MNIWNDLMDKFRGAKDPYDEIDVYGEGNAAPALNRYDSYDSGVSSSEKVMRFAPSGEISNANIHKVVKFVGVEYNAKRKEAFDYFKNGHRVYINMENVNREVKAHVLNFLAGMAYALDGSVKRISEGGVYAILPQGDEIGGDIYDDEENNAYNEYSRYI